MQKTSSCISGVSVEGIQRKICIVIICQIVRKVLDFTLLLSFYNFQVKKIYQI